MKPLYPNFENGWTVWRFGDGSIEYKAYQYTAAGEQFPFVHYTNDGKPFVYYSGDCEGSDYFFMNFISEGDMIVTGDGEYVIGYNSFSVSDFMRCYTNEQPKTGRRIPSVLPEVTLTINDTFSGAVSSIQADIIDASGAYWFPTDKPKKRSWLKRLWHFLTSKF